MRRSSRKRRGRSVAAGAGYWTVEIPYQAAYAGRAFMPTDSSGPFRVLTRGAFTSNREAVQWAQRNLPAKAKVRFRYIHA